MALTVQQQQAIRASVRAYIDAIGATADNAAAGPAVSAHRLTIRSNILGPTATFISDEKFWCLFDELTSYVLAGARLTNTVLRNSTGQELSGAGVVEALHAMRRELGP